MPIDHCELCNRSVDIDADIEFYITLGDGITYGLCKSCRDKHPSKEDTSAN